MARVTVEDCVDKIPNRVDLVLAAGFRARQLSGGAEPMHFEIRYRAKTVDPKLALPPRP